MSLLFFYYACIIGLAFFFYSCHVFSLLSVAEYVYLFFFFKQKTAYEMRISDWSSDVCSSDLTNGDVFPLHDIFPILAEAFDIPLTEPRPVDVAGEQIGRASCRERVCQYV